MVKIWKCYDCGAEFLYPKLEERVEIHGEVDTMRDEHYTVNLCPECGSEDLMEDYACSACEEKLRFGGSDYCIECMQKIDNVMDTALADLIKLFECDKDEALNMIVDYHERMY